MTNRDLFELCWGNLRRRKTRTALSVIGVVVGVFAIVVMVSIGFGLSETFSRQIESFGNLHTIQVYNWGGSTTDEYGQQISLDDKTIDKIAKIEGVTGATPILSAYLNIGAGHFKTQASIQGIRPDVMEKLGYDVETGRLLNGGDKYSLVFGKNVTYRFFDPRKQESANWNADSAPVDVMMEKIILTGDWNYMTRDEGTGDVKYEQFEAKAVGILASENDESAYNVYMDIDSLREIMEKNQRAEGQTVSTKKTYDQALIYVEDINLVSGICDTIKDSYGFQTYSLNDMLKEMQKTMSTIQLVLGGIGAISLLVAAIGIANTMVMSVYERTREISVMKVIGASLTDIRKMFLFEAGMIGFLGGLFGLLLSFIVSKLMNTVLLDVFAGFVGGGEGAVVSIIPWWVAIGALVFAALVGVISGYVPANRAMNLSVLEGLKNE